MLTGYPQVLGLEGKFLVFRAPPINRWAILCSVDLKPRPLFAALTTLRHLTLPYAELPLTGHRRRPSIYVRMNVRRHA